METYIINGVEVEYDTYDVTNMEIYGAEVQRLAELGKKLDATMDKTDYFSAAQALRTFCEEILDAFDCILGEGSSRNIFGDKVNVKAIMNAYVEFTSAVNKATSTMFGAENPKPAVRQPENMNREQRRAAERAKRRAEAAERAKARAHAEKPV